MEGLFEPGFRDLLKEFEFTVFETHSGTIFGLWPDLRLAYLNPWWFRFAGENGGEPSISRDWGLGRSSLDATPDVLKPFYEGLYRKSLQNEGPRPVQHEYECSSAKLFRRFIMTVYALGRGEGFIVVNSLVIEAPHDRHERKARRADFGAYTAADGFVRQCANCRRVRNVREKNRWDWVPAWVDRPPAHTSHTFCDVCFAYYYSGSEPLEGRLP